MAKQKTVDIALFGATGFTGGLVAEYLAQSTLRTPIRWAIAGRNQHKLTQLRARLMAQNPKAVAPELLSADSADEASLRELATRAKVVISTVGPYAKYGELLVKACAEVGADYVDLTGEPGFADKMIERYHAVAQKSGAKIVHACGFDSIPHDMGAFFTLQALRKRMSESEQATLPVKIEGFVRAGGTFSGGTWHSAVTAMGNARSDEVERRRRAKTRVASRDGRKIKNIGMKFGYRKELGLWSLPMPSIDPQIVLRSARALPEYGPSFSYGHFIGLRHLYQAAGLSVGAGAVFTLAQLKPTRELLLKAKDPGDGPSPEQRAKGWFTVTFLGEAGQHKVKCEVRGGDPGYGDTAKMLAESALCLALDRERLPAACGEVTTAQGLGAPLIERLQQAGIRFVEAR